MRFWRPTAIVAIVGAACAAAGPSPAAAAAAAGSSQPPQLQVAEREMSGLTVATERFAGKIELAGHPPRRLGALREETLSFSGEAGTSSPSGRFSFSVRGRELTELQIGETLYIREPRLAARDGGRPWVEQKLGGSGSAFGIPSGIGLSGSRTRTSTPFAGTAKLLEAASHVRSLGPGTLAAQPVVGYTGSLAYSKLVAQFFSTRAVRRFRRAHVHPRGRIEVFVSATGVPVRTSLVLAVGNARLESTLDVLAINFPLLAPAAPPASETIVEAEFEALSLHGKRPAKG